MTKSESSVGLSMKYCRFGAVNVHGSDVGKSCVPTFQFDPAGGENVMRIASFSWPIAHMNVAGMFMCACVVSMPT